MSWCSPVVDIDRGVKIPWKFDVRDVIRDLVRDSISRRYSWLRVLPSEHPQQSRRKSFELFGRSGCFAFLPFHELVEARIGDVGLLPRKPADGRESNSVYAAARLHILEQVKQTGPTAAPSNFCSAAIFDG